jgi:hypothetical protein
VRKAKRTKPGRRLGAFGWGVVAALVVVPLLIMLAKFALGIEVVERYCSFNSLPPEMRHRAMHLLFAPIGALAVVFTRLTLGLRVLGPFRSVLLAIAFQVTGAAVGLVFFAIVLAVVVVVRPWIKRLRLPYFGRAAALLVAVVVVIIVTTLIGLASGWQQVERVVYFPIVVLTLAGEAFANTIRKEGAHSALWRAASTAVTGLVITGLSTVEPLQDWMIRCPETELLILAAIVVVCDRGAYRVFEALNPPPQKRRKKVVRASADPKAVSGVPGTQIRD